MSSSGPCENTIPKMAHRPGVLKGLKGAELGSFGGDNGGDLPQDNTAVGYFILHNILILQS